VFLQSHDSSICNAVLIFIDVHNRTYSLKNKSTYCSRQIYCACVFVLIQFKQELASLFLFNCAHKYSHELFPILELSFHLDQSEGEDQLISIRKIIQLSSYLFIIIILFFFFFNGHLEYAALVRQADRR